MPQHSAALLVIALELFVHDEEAGIRALDALKGVPMNAFERSFLRERLRDEPYLPRSYLRGATPQNDYTPDKPLTLFVYDDFRPPLAEGYLRLLVESSGAEERRALTLRLRDGRWYLWEYAALLMRIRLPDSEEPWT